MPLMLSVSASAPPSSVPKLAEARSSLSSPFAEVDGDAGRGACCREGHSISAGQGQDITTTHGSHDGDPIAWRGSRIATGSTGLDSEATLVERVAPALTVMLAPAVVLVKMPLLPPVTEAVVIVVVPLPALTTEMPAPNPETVPALLSIRIALGSRIAYLSKNSARRRSCDIGGCDADTASGIGGTMTVLRKAVTHDRTTACVDGDTGVGASVCAFIPRFSVPPLVTFPSGHVADVDIAAGASASIGVMPSSAEPLTPPVTPTP